MNKLYSIIGVSALGESSAIVLQMFILMSVLAGVAWLAIGIGHWKVRNRFITKFKSSNPPPRDRDRSSKLSV
jgi:hypothetical protein